MRRLRAARERRRGTRGAGGAADQSPCSHGGSPCSHSFGSAGFHARSTRCFAYWAFPALSQNSGTLGAGEIRLHLAGGDVWERGTARGHASNVGAAAAAQWATAAAVVTRAARAATLLSLRSGTSKPGAGLHPLRARCGTRHVRSAGGPLTAAAVRRLPQMARLSKLLFMGLAAAQVATLSAQPTLTGGACPTTGSTVAISCYDNGGMYTDDSLAQQDQEPIGGICFKSACLRSSLLHQPATHRTAVRMLVCH